MDLDLREISSECVIARVQNCIIIQDIYFDGVVALDGRLRSGDQLLEVRDFWLIVAILIDGLNA